MVPFHCGHNHMKLFQSLFQPLYLKSIKPTRWHFHWLHFENTHVPHPDLRDPVYLLTHSHYLPRASREAMIKITRHNSIIKRIETMNGTITNANSIAAAPSSSANNLLSLDILINKPPHGHDITNSNRNTKWDRGFIMM